MSLSDALDVAAAAALAAAAAEAACYRGATAPNPPVGCALLDASGSILALAAHRQAGTPHAEAAAIALCRDAGSIDRVHRVVVTLEPCNHWGRTPPCTEAILATPAQEVVVGVRDPNPRVEGGGVDRLRAAGLVVRVLDEGAGPRDEELARRCAELVAPFAKHSATGRPWVTVKQALDERGSMIPPAGHKTFTSDAALRYAHQLRKRADAILTGSGTVLADDPEFTVRRVADHHDRRRHIVVLDRRRRTAAFGARAALRNLVPIQVDDLAEALDRLGAAGALEVLVEAGPAVTRSMLESGLWDEHVVIHKGGAADGADRVVIRRRGVAHPQTFELG